MLKTHTKIKCEHCGKEDILNLIEYKDIGICIWVCADCYDKINDRVKRLEKRIKRFILRPRGGK